MALVASPIEMKLPWPSATAATDCVSEQMMTRRVSQAVRRAQDGDREALGFLYTCYADNVHGYVRSIVHDPHEAERHAAGVRQVDSRDRQIRGA